MKKGPLVRVELQPGRYVKKYEADAVRDGYAEDEDGVWRLGVAGPDPKKKAPQETKIRKPQEDKGKRPPEEKEAEQQETKAMDDFTVIDGVGPATARALAAHDIRTFDELRAANLDFLTGQALAAIEEWRDDG